ncbi:MAG: hypothetical protein D6778_08710 [Nitrospirae bacterium]|nr:MAG: hypothetical protein D6778_08710 [Nitrospirota bacterium]
MSLLHLWPPSFMKGVFLFVFFMFIISACTEKEKIIEEKKAPERMVKDRTPVKQILDAPEQYRDKEVIVEGTAKPGLAFEFVDEQPYLLSDDSGEIWVITRGLMPEEGSKVTVRGVVASPYQIKGRRYRVAILEKERQ